MPRRRTYKKSSRPTNRIIRAANTAIAISSQSIGYLYTADDPQTATNFKLTLGSLQSQSNCPYVLVYVPEGYNVNAITYPAVNDDMYNPTGNVLMSGVITQSGQDVHRYSRYSRKLKPGDRIALVFANPTAAAEEISWELSFTTIH